MEDLLRFVAAHGYWVVFGIGFAEFSGLPVLGVPVVVAAGALTATTALHPAGVVLAAAAGGGLADLGWYLLGRWRGHRLVGLACGLSSNPGVCVLAVEERVQRLGVRIILPSKFLPGVSNLLAPAAGFARVEPRRFLAADGAALLLWAFAYTLLGRLLSWEVHRLLDWIGTFQDTALAVAVALVLAAAGWRVVRAGGHRRLHAPVVRERSMQEGAVPETVTPEGAAPRKAGSETAAPPDAAPSDPAGAGER